MKITDCNCTAPGWCERHQCDKHEFHWEMCRRRVDWFAMWEAGVMATTPTISVPTRLPCWHRGIETRRVVCSACQGHVDLKVLACDVHHECTVARVFESLACCLMCIDFVPVEPGLTASR